MKTKILTRKIVIFLLLAYTTTAWNYSSLGPSFNFVDNTTPQDFTRPNVAILGTNAYIILWTASPRMATPTVGDIYILIIKSTGEQLLPVTQVNTIGNYNTYSSATVDNKGGFIVAWFNTTDPNSCLTTGAVYARYYNSNFVPGAELKIGLQPSYCVKEAVPFVKFTGAQFIVCNNALLQRFTIDSSKNVVLDVSPVKSIEAATTAENSNCVLADLKNGNIVVAYVYSDTIYWGILGISNWGDVQSVGSLFSTSLPHANPSIAVLNTFVFVLAWLQNGTFVNIQTWSFAGSMISTATGISNTGVCCPVARTLGSNGFIVAYGGVAFTYKLFQNDSTINGLETYVPNPISTTQPLNVDGNDSNFITVQSDNSSVYVNIYGVSNPTPVPKCNDSTIFIGNASGNKMKVKFATINSTSYVYFYSNPVSGALVTLTGVSLASLFIKYSQSNVYYKYTTPKNDSFLYSNNALNGNCKVTFIACYISCATCISLGNQNDNQCNNCDIANNYFPAIDKTSNCFLSTDAPQGYYLTHGFWYNCYTGCATCTRYPTSPNIDMLCSTCISGYTQQGTNCYNVQPSQT
jgi:hypothetical protein